GVTVSVGASLAVLQPARFARIVIIVKSSAVSHHPRKPIQNRTDNRESKWNREQPKQARTESADDASVAEVSTSAQEDEQREKAHEVRNRVQCITQARAPLLADALGFVVPHWLDKEHGVVERPNEVSDGDEPSLTSQST